MKLYRKKKESFLQKLFKLIIFLLVIGIITDIYFPNYFQNSIKYVTTTYKKVTGKVEIIEAKDSTAKEIENLDMEKKEEIKVKRSHPYEALYENQIYRTINNENLILTVRRPKTKDEVPVVMYIFGTDWKLEKEKTTAVLEGLRELSKNKISLIEIEYRDVERGTFPAQLEDLQEAVKFLQDNKDNYGIDMNRIGIVGGNTGGTIAQLLGIQLNSELNNSIKMVMTLGAPTDLITLTKDADGKYIDKMEAVARYDRANTNTAKLIGFHTENWMGIDQVKKMLLERKDLEKSYYWKYVEIAKSVSPLEYANEKTPPMLIVHNINDENIPVNQSIRLIEKLNKLGIENKFISSISKEQDYSDKQIVDLMLNWGLGKLDVK